MIARAETLISGAMPVAVVYHRTADRRNAVVAPAIVSGWTTLRSLLTRWLARRRLSRSVAHLDDRLLADVGLGPRDLGFYDRLIRRYVTGADTWAGDKAAR
jgi:uncharacterized protein YjiS (DUF1127 family)